MVASCTVEELHTDGLLAGEDYRLRGITLLAGQVLARGAVLGRITLGAAASSVKSGGNTGGGTLTLDATTPVLAWAEVGVYRVRCIAAATGGGTFRVTAPRGEVLGDVAVGETFASRVQFAIADGAPDYAVGDGWDITLAAGSGKYRLCTAAAVDGSAVPDAILAEAGGGAADTAAVAYVAGQFAAPALVLGAGHSLGSVREPMRAKDIHIVPVLGS